MIVILDFTREHIVHLVSDILIKCSHIMPILRQVVEVPG